MIKRALALFAALIAMTAMMASAAAESIPGDVNGCGEATAADAAVTLRAVYGLTTLDNAGSITADVTGDMAVSAADVCAILLHSVGRVASFSDIRIPNNSILGEAHLDKFAYGGTVTSDTSYLSDRVSITLSTVEAGDAVCRVADIYVHDITSLSTAFSGGEYLKQNSLAGTDKIAAEVSALLAVNGDFYSQSSRGLIVRNGEWYREKANVKVDVGVLYRDGSMKTFPAGEASREKIESFGEPWQSWNYGPSLLDEEGAALKYFTKISTLSRRTMRTAIGCYGPGHYCLIAVEGRANTDSSGMTIAELADFCASLGCKQAYNLAGGETSTMVFHGVIVNTLRGDSRPVSDIVYIAEPTASGKAQ